MGKKSVSIVKGLIISYLLTIIMLFIIAVVVYKIGISDNTLNILVILVYIVATFVGGFYTGRKVEEKRFIWGALFGLMYITVALLVSLMISGEAGGGGVQRVTRSIMCIAGGMLGAMLS